MDKKTKTFMGISLNAFPMWAFSKDTCFKCGEKATYQVEIGTGFADMHKQYTKCLKHGYSNLVVGGWDEHFKATRITIDR